MENTYTNKQRYSLFFEEQEKQMRAFYAELNLSTEPSVQLVNDDNYELRRELEELDFEQRMNNFWDNFNN